MSNNYDYDISIIIPIYNCEIYIDSCFKSIKNQDYDFNKIQIVMIDDGSIDNSFEICERIQSKYSNVIAVSQENAGVSATRNRAMDLSTGKYILFLDADDYLSDDSIKKLVAFFDEHYDEIDLVTYPIFTVNTAGVVAPHFRYEQYFGNENSIFNIDKDEECYLIQATINVVVKNNIGVRFDEDLHYSEDEKFCTECIMRKHKLGYVADAAYYYRKTGVNTTAKKANPLYTFEPTVNYYESLFEKYSINGKVPPYIQSLFISNFRWRYLQNKLFPTHMNEEEYKIIYERFLNIVRQLDTEVIINFPYLPKGHMIVLFKLQNKEIQYDINKKGAVTLTVDSKQYPFTALNVTLMRAKLIGRTFKIIGLLEHACLADLDCEFIITLKYFNKEDKIIKPQLKVSRYSFYIKDDVIVPKYIFDEEIDIKKLKSITFNVRYNGESCAVRLKQGRFSSETIYGSDYTLNCVNKKGIITRKIIKQKPSKIKKLTDRVINRITKNNNKKEKIWLYNDTAGVYENAYYQFMHDIKKNDGIKRYYVYNDSKRNAYKHFDSISKKHLVKYQSKKHIKYFVDSAKILTSFSDLSVYIPVMSNFKDYYGKLHYELVYLQHGVLYANLRNMYTKENREIDKFVISSDFEKNNLINNYNYNEKDLISGGMPRYSLKSEHKNKDNSKRKIIFAPSWRSNLTGPLVNGKRTLDVPNFISSSFYKGTQELLNSKELLKILEENDIIVDYKLHPNFKGYEEYFELKSDRIKMSFGDIDLNDYDLFITDFSSFQFDFVNLHRPILYFIPDIVEFKAGLHTYKKLELSDDELFGPISYNSENLIKNIIDVIKNNYTVEQPYSQRMKEFFNIAENPCDAIYNALIK